MFADIFNSTLEFLFPRTCIGCTDYLNPRNGEPLCPDCSPGLFELQGPTCRVCHEPHHQRHKRKKAGQQTYICGRCLSESPPFERARAPYEYTGLVRDIILSIKLGGARWKIKPFAKLYRPWAETYLSNHGFDPDKDIITAVPTHHRRLRQRGFDHLRQILEATFAQQPFQAQYELVKKTRATARQTTLSKEDRLKNLEEAFRLDRKLNNCRNAFVFDDVLTTGATACSISKQLQGGGVNNVFVFTIARSALF